VKTDEATLDEYALSDAAYVLGALSPDDRREFEAHLQGCATCTSSVAELTDLPALMSAVSLEQLMAELEPLAAEFPLTMEAESLPELLLPSLARAVRRERARRRLAIGAAAGAACLIGVGALAITRPDAPAPPAVASPTAPLPGTANLALTAVVPSPVTASARLVDMAWGTRIDLTCTYRPREGGPARSIPYALVVIDRSGAASQVATWKSLPDRELTLMGASSRSRADIAAVEIRTLSGRAILRLST
jgi:Putative zinc-finger